MTTGVYKRKKIAVKKKMTATTKKPAPLGKAARYSFVLWTPPYQTKKTLLVKGDGGWSKSEWNQELATVTRWWKRLSEVPSSYLTTQARTKLARGPQSWLPDGVSTMDFLEVDHSAFVVDSKEDDWLEVDE